MDALRSPVFVAWAASSGWAVRRGRADSRLGQALAAFHWGARAGHFECLALAPSADAGRPGSGNFDTNVMYVTGPITVAELNGDSAVLKGSSTVTGLGAGSDRPFTATVTRGGPGATLVLEGSGLTFREILLEGRFRF
jgi:hypothetical protein